MRTTFTTLTLSLCLAAGALARAQAPGADAFVLSGGLAFAQGDAKDVTRKTSGGYTFEVGYEFAPKDYRVSFLVYGGWKKLPAGHGTADRLASGLAGPHAGFDLVYRPWDALPITLSTGPSASVWQVDGAPDTPGDQGLKLGWRAGVTYAYDAQWSAGVKYTITEWRNDPAQVEAPVRPAFLTLMINYRF